MSLIDVGKLAEPAKVLIEKISDAVGGVFQPWQIRRVARAEADRDKILAIANIEINEIEQRALARSIREQGKHQENMERITAGAIPLLKAGAKSGEMEEDWLAHFLNKARIVSDLEMQSLWSQLLAGEANSPGKYSKRTLEFVSTLDKMDAQLFTKLCTFVWNINNQPVLLALGGKIYEDYGIIFDAYRHLSDIGLISFNTGPRPMYFLEKIEKQISTSYHGKIVELELPKDSDNRLNVGSALLTHIGEELAPICGSEPSEDFFLHVLQIWHRSGYITSSPLSQ